MQKFFDVRHPIFLPVWRRIVAVALPALWSLVEIAQGAATWGAVFVACAAYLAYAFFIAWDDDEVRAMKDDR